MKKQYECKKCGYKWKSRVEVPITCPRCKRYDYWKEDKSEEDKQ